MTAVKRYYLARNRDHERVMSKITERDKPFLKIPGDEWVRAEDYDALANRVDALHEALQNAADSLRSHGFAVDAEECEEAIRSVRTSVQQPAPPATASLMHDFVGPDRTNVYVHCKNCGLIFKPLQGRGPCPGPADQQEAQR